MVGCPCFLWVVKAPLGNITGKDTIMPERSSSMSTKNKIMSARQGDLNWIKIVKTAVEDQIKEVCDVKPQILTVSIERCKSNGQHLSLRPGSGPFPPPSSPFPPSCCTTVRRLPGAWHRVIDWVATLWRAAGGTSSARARVLVATCDRGQAQHPVR